ncbi:MAG: helix-turn-helix domain-containing protein [Lachnospiraceae bacterium]|nr:helix-turn-helix domain-containing protein [Lachnospiraceae bacterium]
MIYESTTLKQEIIIDRVISIHYFEYMNDFSFEGESHDFWEFLCVDKGTVNVLAGDTTYTLNKGDIIFHQPNEFHNVKANGIIAPNLVVIGFECSSPAMEFFRCKLLKIGQTEQNLLGSLIQEARASFSGPLDDPYSEKLIRSEHQPFAGEQLIKMYLQQVLIHLYRINNVPAPVPPRMLSVKQKSADELFCRITSYMEDNIGSHITIDQICRDNLVSRSILQKLFKEHADCGVIDYFSQIKINAAKHMIRNQHMNFTQIADNLGYASIHYFSRQFKKLTGMTPSEYASSIKLLSEPNDKKEGSDA